MGQKAGQKRVEQELGQNERGGDKCAIVWAVVSCVLVVAMCVFIFGMSAVPSEGSDELSLGVASRIVGLLVPGYDQLSVAEQLAWQQALNHPIRKTAHFLEYALLGALVFNMLVQVARARGAAIEVHGRMVPLGSSAAIRQFAIAAWALATMYAATDEVHQVFVPGRSGMPTDVLLDSAGVLVGVVLCALLVRRILR